MKNKFIMIGMAISLILALGMSGFAEKGKKEKSKEKAVPRKEFKVLGLDYKGTKLWIPSNLIVRKGDRVKIQLTNKIGKEGSTHGYAINQFGVKVVIANGSPQTVVFDANKAGVFKIYCHQHPAHIGGQLLVLE